MTVCGEIVKYYIGIASWDVMSDRQGRYENFN